MTGMLHVIYWSSIGVNSPIPRHLQTLRASVALPTSNLERDIIGRSCGEARDVMVCIYIYMYGQTPHAQTLHDVNHIYMYMYS